MFQSKGDNEDALVHSFFGRIGVSLMLRYHKTHQWAKVSNTPRTPPHPKIMNNVIENLKLIEFACNMVVSANL